MAGGGQSAESTSYGYLPYVSPQNAQIIGSYQKNAADAAASLAQQNLTSAMAQIAKNFSAANSALAPYRTTGVQAQNELNRYLGLDAYNPGAAPTRPESQKVTQPEIMQYIQGHTDPSNFNYSGVGSNLIFNANPKKGSIFGAGKPNNEINRENTALIQGEVGKYLQGQYDKLNQVELDAYNKDLAEYNQNKAWYEQYSKTGPYSAAQITEQIQNQPGFESQLNQGIDAIQKAASAKGLLSSGNMLKDLSSFGSALQGQYYQGMLDRLAHQAGQGAAAAGGTADLYGQQGGALASLRSQLGDTLANSALAGGQALANAWQLGNTQYNKVVTGQSSSSSGGGLSGLGSIMGGLASMKSAGIFSSKTLKTKGKSSGVSLDSLDDLPVEKWKYKKDTKIEQDPTEHIGPYAEDFKKVFGVGDGKTIPLIDGIGVLYGLVKELNSKVKKLSKEVK